MENFTFQCSICGDNSHKICHYCTKDACNNHLCHRCACCSDCCRCDRPTNAEEQEDPVEDQLPELVETNQTLT